jgi:hypothetical protein
MMKLYLLIVLILFSLGTSQVANEDSQRYWFHGNMGLYARVLVNETKWWPQYSLFFTFRSRSKDGMTFVKLQYTTTSIAMIFWRDDAWNLIYTHVNPNATMADFTTINKQNDLYAEMISGNRYFNYLHDFQEITLYLNSSNIPSRNLYNWTLTVATVNYADPVMQGRRYVNFKWDDSVTMSYDDMIPGYYNVLFFIRWEAYHPAFWSCCVGIYIINFGLLFVYRNHQPLKSRGIMPYLLNIFQLFVLMLCLLNWFGTIEFLAKIRCYVRVFIFYPIFVSLLLGSVMIYTRYNLFKLINHWKDGVVKARNGYFSTKSRVIKFYQLLQTNTVQLIIFFVFLITLMVLFLIVHLSTSNGDIRSFHCRPVEFAYWTGIIFTIVMMFLNVPLAVYVDWDDWKRCKWKTLFFKDSLSFKFEIYVLFVAFVIWTVTAQILFNFLGILNSTPWHIVGISLQHTILYTIQCWHPLVRTIINHMFSCCISKKKQNFLVEILDDPRGMKMLYSYAKTEFAVENVSCYDDVLKYEHEMDEIKRREMAEKIWDLYLDQGKSMLEVNIVQFQRNAVWSLMKAGYFPTSLFDHVKAALLANIGDTYSRLLRTSIFAEYQRETKFLKEWHLQDEQVEKFKESRRELREPLL